MTTLIVAGASQIGGALIRTAGSAALSFANQVIGRAFDNRNFEGPRLESFHLQTSRDGAPMSRVYGRVRLAGQVIWASRLTEHVTEETVQGGKGSGPTQTNFSYTISFAIGLCEGEILGVDRLWANGTPLRDSGLIKRVYTGSEDQLPDPVISAIEQNPPAFRGTAYIVFEDFPLDDYGARLPQINAEVLRVPPPRDNKPRLETLVRGINLIPASGEFSYATDIAEETPGPLSARPLNMNNLSGQPDIMLALDQLQAQLPNVKNVSIITAWFGTDLRCGHCRFQPGIETGERVTPDVTWQVSGVKRNEAYLISRDANGRPNYGGTPSDRSILQAITELKSRGYKVTLYPFILMDIPVGNGLPDPYGGTEQGAFPWRGRITCFPPGTEHTDDVVDQIDAFFGNAQTSDFNVKDGLPDYDGDEFSYRRFILHYAKLAQISGEVDRFVIGSEMRELTTLRDGQSEYPAVHKFVQLAQDARDLLGLETKITYAADWSEYFGHHPQDGSGDVSFHLDPLWASPATDAIGIDAYFPLSDWRGETNYTTEYLQSQMEGGEGYDYFYVSQEARADNTPTPITDGAASKPWVFRYKDVRQWWSQPHYNRRGGIELGAPTDWTPQSKPIWLMEIGCPAIHNGAHQPNVFFDAKSSEHSIPYFSNGGRDDLIQRRYIEAFIDYWAGPYGHNPQSDIYNGPMIDLDMINVWCWDARPFPDFPARANIWSDGENWERGHWLTGRIGLLPLADVVFDICQQSGLGVVDTQAVTGVVQGYHLDHAMTGRGALTPLSALYGFSLIETASGLRFASEGTAARINLSQGDIAGNLPSALSLIKSDPEQRVRDVRVHFIDMANDYQLGLTSARDRAAETVRVIDINAPLVMDQSFARYAADQILERSLTGEYMIDFTLTQQRPELEVGDEITLPGMEQIWEIQSLEGLTTQRVSAQSISGAEALPRRGAVPKVTQDPVWIKKPVVFALDLPGAYDGPLVGAAQAPFSPATIKGAQSELIATAPIHMGALLTDLEKGPLWRWDYATHIEVFLPGVNLSSLTDTERFSGRNIFAVETPLGWEVFRAARAQLIAPNHYKLSHLLRGLQGSEADMADVVLAGARITPLSQGWAALSIPASLIGETVTLTVQASGRRGDDLDFPYQGKNLRPLAPVQVKINYSGRDVDVSWIRQSRIDAENWGGLDVPLGEEKEIYRVQLTSQAQTLSEYQVELPHIRLSKEDVMTAQHIRIAQGSQQFGWGAPRIITL